MMNATAAEPRAPKYGRLMPVRVLIYAALTLLTLAALAPVVSERWQRVSPGRGGQTATVGEPLAAEVQKAAERWKGEGFGWPMHAIPTGLYSEILPVDMAGLENQDLSRWRKAATADWQGVDGLPTVAGNYIRGRVAASGWPRPGSAAVELRPAMAADPDQATNPWRVVLLFGSSAEETTYARQAVADAGGTPETLRLGRAAGSTLAVPVDRQNVGGVATYYCVCPTSSSLDVAGVKLRQVVQAPPTAAEAAAKRYGAWRTSYDAFLATVKERDRTATTPEQRERIKADILAWKAQNPEPPRPAGNEVEEH